MAQNRKIQGVKTKDTFNHNRNKANYMNGSKEFLIFLDIKQTIKENIFFLCRVM